MYSDVAPREEHVKRGFLADLFLDTPACNAHTTACDILWSGTPMLTMTGDKMVCEIFIYLYTHLHIYM
jgi:protein O-GlcNAc transferase